MSEKMKISRKTRDKFLAFLFIVFVFFFGFSFGRLFPHTQYHYIVSEYQGPEWNVQGTYANQTKVGIAFEYQFTVDPHHEGWRSWTEYRRMGISLNASGHFEFGVVWVESEPPEALNRVEILNAYVVGTNEYLQFQWEASRINATYYEYYANIWMR